MAESYTTTEVLTGGAVLAVALGFLVYAGNATGLGGGTAGQYELTASFRSAEGVSVGTDVRLAGVKVGTVTDLTLNPETFRADARFTVDDGVALPDDSAALVASEGLLGGTFVELVPGGSPFELEPGDEVLDTQGAVSLISLLMKFVTSSAEEGG
ncbi:phospholipid/cholesterol/gamma-HCH transport system substrate-binding protein [Rhodovulum sp. ES.010]|uniref:outer membrane lipid asymmetry maintenance protein MlaD n=1 Tax=Rhodovulum sp. ES.010 TaxID=1882821 RepID=UPI00092CDCBE|nr:outer membrane lipid asymmetry maintenance protein MlaD [Rhodovulum sp. ES.010]SIO11470.1 phospholipid/cholesterol/gamma-HCH transport system substrate-binding protein [Rhodovulum sp. ES.010]